MESAKTNPAVDPVGELAKRDLTTRDSKGSTPIDPQTKDAPEVIGQEPQEQGDARVDESRVMREGPATAAENHATPTITITMFGLMEWFTETLALDGHHAFPCGTCERHGRLGTHNIHGGLVCLLESVKALTQRAEAAEARVKEALLSADARSQQIELKYRRELWLGHGHQGLYGDDGEMQCGKCGGLFKVWDYRRAPLEQVEDAAAKARLMRVSQALEEKASADARSEREGRERKEQEDTRVVSQG